MKKLFAAALFAATISTASAAYAAPDNFIFGTTPAGVQALILNGTTTIEASAKGWLREDGSHNPNNNYIVGYCANCGGYMYNNYFTFDLSNIDFAITSAVLSVGNGFDYYGGDLSTYSLFDVDSSILSLGVPRIPGDASGITIFNDLQSGSLFGSRSITSVVANSQVDTTLNGSALAALNAAVGGDFAIGGTLRPGREIPGVPTGGVPEPATWALMIAGFGLAGTMLRRERRASVGSVTGTNC